MGKAAKAVSTPLQSNPGQYFPNHSQLRSKPKRDAMQSYPGGRTMAKMLNDFQVHGKDIIGKGVKRVFVMLGVCDLVDNSV